MVWHKQIGKQIVKSLFNQSINKNSIPDLEVQGQKKLSKQLDLIEILVNFGECTNSMQMYLYVLRNLIISNYE